MNLAKLLHLLSGKKTTLGIILMAILVWLQGRGYVMTDTATLVSGIMIALGLTANIATKKILNK